MTPSVIREPKILPLDRKLPVVMATLPQREPNQERWFKSKHMRRNVALHNQAARQTQDMYVKKHILLTQITCNLE